jgi:hypothetical protein
MLDWANGQNLAATIIKEGSDIRISDKMLKEETFSSPSPSCVKVEESEEEVVLLNLEGKTENLIFIIAFI